MPFRKYMHVERLGSPEVAGIEFGLCHVFPKIDGTNGSLWLDDGKLQCGSRRRHLDEGTLDNFGFRASISEDDRYVCFLRKYPDLRLYGEWLVPHSLKTYRDEAWRKFYVFDAYSDVHEYYLPYDDYKEMLDEFEIEYIPPICTIENPTSKALNQILEGNKYLVRDGEGVGEGIVIKRYDYKNKFGFCKWAKVVRQEFKDLHSKEMGAPEKKSKNDTEAHIVDKFVTRSMVDKVYAKLAGEDGFSAKQIPALLSTVYHDLVTEETWRVVKEHRNPTIDFKRLMGLTYAKTKSFRPELF